MKVGILTFYFAHNYGAMLQAYALKKYLSSRADAEIIPYYPIKMYKNDTPFPMHGDSFKRIVAKMFKLPQRMKQYVLFEKFRRQLLNNKAYNYLNYENYDAIVIGSDQVWNLDITFNDLTYFGDRENLLKYSYAASIGTDAFPANYCDEIVMYLKSFSEISVREYHAKFYLEHLLNKPAEIVCDPVFLLKKEEWRRMARIPKRFKQNRFLLYYSLQDNNDMIQAAEKYAYENSLKIIVIHPQCGKQIIKGTYLKNVGPREFIYLIEKADAVFSNSFHACAFSIIFGKRLFFKLHSKTGNRVASLLEMINYAPEKYRDINYMNCENLIHNLRHVIEDSKEFLGRVCD